MVSYVHAPSTLLRLGAGCGVALRFCRMTFQLLYACACAFQGFGRTRRPLAKELTSSTFVITPNRVSCGEYEAYN